MAKNEFLTFGTAANANVLPNADYQALPARSSGFGSGVAKSEQLNKVWRQSSVMTSAMAQYIADSTGNDVLDNGDMAALSDGLSSALSGRLIGVKVFTTSQTYTPTIGAKKLLVEVVGAGGGGQGAGAQYIIGGGGGSGAYVKALITSPDSSYVITIGNGGTGTSAMNASEVSNAGGDTSFGSLITCRGGKGGISDKPPTAPTTGSSCIAPGGLGGAATTSSGITILVSQSGSRGSYGTAIHPNYLGGNGSNSPLGAGGAGGATTGPLDSFKATGYGSGGGGNATVSTASPGGNGANGAVIVWEYA